MFGEMIKFDLRIVFEMGCFNHQLDKVADLSPQHFFPNYQPQILPKRDLRTGEFPGFGGFDSGPNLQPHNMAKC